MQASGAVRRTELISVQYLRGIAALMVVFFHIASNSGLFNDPMLQERSKFLNAGVDIFFVISGFIMWHTTRGRNVTSLRFMTDRIIRIVPLYWAVTLLVLAIALFAPALMRSTVFDLEHGLKSLFFIPSHGPTSPHEWSPVVVPGWSLNYEMFFYVIFALSLMLPARFALAFLAGAITLVFAGASLMPGSGVQRFYGDEMMLEFILGVALGEAVAKGFQIPKRLCVALVVAGFAMIAASAFYDVTRILKWGLPALAIVGGAVLYERSTEVPHVPALKMIGDSSYSLYLTHGLVIAAAAKVLSKIMPADSGWIGAQFGVAVILAASIIAGYIGHRLIEKPSSAWLKNTLRMGTKPSLAGPAKNSVAT
jgi:exopolysaccharide production protein ExoZ